MHPGCPESIKLQIGFLVDGRDPRIAYKHAFPLLFDIKQV
jgi:hypothetical protein